MEYVSLDDELKEKVKEKVESYSPHRLVKVETEDGRSYSAELLNGKKLKLVGKIDLEDISDIHPR